MRHKVQEFDRGRLPSSCNTSVEQISQLVGHRGTTVTELVYRHQLRPVLQTGATVMDRLFEAQERDAECHSLVTR